jgi:putative amino-acid transport system substrate-binding protein
MKRFVGEETMLTTATPYWNRLLTLLMAMSILMMAGCDSSAPEKAAKGNDKNQQTPIKVGMSGGYFPFTFSKGDKLQGFEVDLWQEIGRRLDRPVEFVTANFSGLFGMLEAGKVDTLSNQITKTEQRIQKYLFSDTYAYDGVQIAVQQQNQNINGFKDLCGKQVAVNLGSNYESLLRKKDSQNCIKIKTYDTGIEQDVVIGRVDAFVMDRNSILALIKESQLPLRLAGAPLEFMENAMPFLKTESGKALQQQVNQVLHSMRKDGTLKALSVKWFETDITTGGDPLDAES